MKRSRIMKKTLLNGLLIGSLVLSAGTAGAVDYYLAAKAYTKTMPDASTISMWGYVLDPAGACYAEVADVDRVSCVDGLPDPVVPGPRLTVDPTDDMLHIYLTNALPAPTSIMIAGRELPWSNANNGPTWSNGDIGPRCADMNACTEAERNKRVRSFGREADADGGRQEYIWDGAQQTEFDRPGTSVYHSATHPQVQVYMGLSGAVTKDDAVGQAYPGVPYTSEIVMFYSDIDPDHNAQVTAGTHDTSIDYHARWFLINGEPYSTGMPDELAGAVGEQTLVRFLSTASETHVPVLQGMHMYIHSEDGHPYAWEDTIASTSGTAPREQYSVMLPPLKTKDAVIMPTLAGRYAIYDGNGYMTDPSDKDDVNVGDDIGGMLRFVNVPSGPPQPPVAVDDPSELAVEGRTISIDVLANDSDPEGQALNIVSVDTTGTVGAVSCDFNPGGLCDYTAAGPGADTFMYTMSDGDAGTADATATVTVTVAANETPVANPDPAETDTLTPVVVNVLSNDTDGNGDALEIAAYDALSANGSAVSCDMLTGDCTYTPTLDGVDTFTYTTTDGDATSAAATVTVTVTIIPTNTAPVATDDAYATVDSAVLAGNVITDDTGNGIDSDADGDAITAMQVGAAPVNAASFTLNADGSFSYQSTTGFVGDDTFTYLVNDGTEDGNTATVTITVTAIPNTAPVATNDSYATADAAVLAGNVITDDTGSGVDSDADGDAITAMQVGGDPANAASFTLNADGSFSYESTAGFDGVDTFDYLVNDGTVDGNTATVSITVTAATPQELTVTTADCTRLGSGNCDWLFEGDKQTGTTERILVKIGSCSGTPVARTSTNVGDGSWQIVASNNSRNNDLSTMAVCVPSDGSSAQVVGVVPTEGGGGGGPNEAPVANADAAATDVATAVVVDVLANDTDANGDALEIASFDATSVNGSAVSCNTATGDCTYTPTVDGVDTFAYTATDGTDTSASATVTVTVTLESQELTVTTAQCTRLGNGNCDWLFEGDKQTGTTERILVKIGSCSGTPVARTSTNVGDGSWQIVANANNRNNGLSTMAVCVPSDGSSGQVLGVVPTEL